MPGMTILVTGGCGFVGANLVPELLARGHAVRVIDDFSIGGPDRLPAGDVEVVQGDVRDAEAVAEAAAGTDAVIHLAAAGNVADSVADPFGNFEANARGTLYTLQAAARAGAGRFVFASTGGALIGDAPPPVDEESMPRPISPYGASKLAGEGYCHAYRGAYGLPTIALRFANVYGPRSELKRGAVTRFVRAALDGTPITIYGDGAATRDFIHVRGARGARSRRRAPPRLGARDVGARARPADPRRRGGRRADRARRPPPRRGRAQFRDRRPRARGPGLAGGGRARGRPRGDRRLVPRPKRGLTPC
jgi:nucleoside-diphosphate-sugar epimerase